MTARAPQSPAANRIGTRDQLERTAHQLATEKLQGMNIRLLLSREIGQQYSPVPDLGRTVLANQDRAFPPLNDGQIEVRAVRGTQGDFTRHARNIRPQVASEPGA